MPFFILIANDRPGAAALRAQVRQEHVDYWQAVGDVVKLGGAVLDGTAPTGSMLLLEARDEEQVRELLNADPFMTSGIFGQSVRIWPFRPAIGEWFHSA